MAKRRSKKKPNIPQATLDRARKQAGLEVEETVEKVEEPKAVEKTVAASDDAEVDDAAELAKAEAAVTPARKRSSRRKVSQAQLERSRSKGELTREMVEEILHNPTETVSSEQLGQEYRHVLLDLRNMGVLAAALMVLLVGLAQFI